MSKITYSKLNSLYLVRNFKKFIGDGWFLSAELKEQVGMIKPTVVITFRSMTKIFALEESSYSSKEKISDFLISCMPSP